MKNKHLWIPLFVFIGAGIVSLIASVIDYKAINPVLAYSSETIQFNYNGASEGVDPDGNRFDPIGFLSDDVIKSALEKTELNCKVDDVRPYIAMENVVPNNILKEVTSYEKILSTDEDDGGRSITSKDYHPVRYRFVVYENKMMSKSKLNKFVENIVDEYNDMFYETYKKSFVNETFNDLFDVSDYDYIYQSQIHVTKIQALMDFAKSLYEEHNDIVFEGKSFRDLCLKAEQLINIDSSKIDNIIILNALSKDVNRLKDYYTYLIQEIDYDLTKYNADLASVSAQIGTNTPGDATDDYKINPTVYVGTGENVIEVKDETAATYNTLLSKQVSISNTIASLTKEKTDYQNILDILNAATGDATAESRVVQMLSKLDSDYQELDALFQRLVEAYNEKYVKEGVTSKTTVKYTSNSILSTSFISRAIRIAAPIMLTTLLGIAIFYLVREIRKEKAPKEIQQENASSQELEIEVRNLCAPPKKVKKWRRISYVSKKR